MIMVQPVHEPTATSQTPNRIVQHHTQLGKAIVVTRAHVVRLQYHFKEVTVRQQLAPFKSTHVVTIRISKEEKQ
jgi:hypothetical protein